MNKVIAVDVDGVVADLHFEWLHRYNEDYDDNLTTQDIKCWDMEKYVKKECGNKIFKYLLDPNLYANVKPVFDARYGINMLRRAGYRVVFVTDASIHPGQKMKWLQKHNFLPDIKDYYEARDKSLIASDYLIDDRCLNVQNAYGKGIVFTQQWNQSLKGYSRLRNWSKVLDLFGNLL